MSERLVLHARRESESLDKSESEVAIDDTLVAAHWWRRTGGGAPMTALYFGPILMKRFDLGAVPLGFQARCLLLENGFGKF